MTGTLIPGAVVTVTMGVNRVVRAEKVGAMGTWRIEFPSATGDFLVHVIAPGYGAFRKRVRRYGPEYATADSSSGQYTLQVALARVAPQQLAAVRVQARRERPSRSRDEDPRELPGGGNEQPTSQLNGAVAPDQAGDLNALASTTPGILATGGGVAALGVAGQNAVTLGGLNVGNLDLPRDARTTTRVATTAYDPARGWFGGAAIDVQLAPGLQYAARRASAVIDAPVLQSTDAAGRALGAPFTGVQASGAGEGTWNDDRWTYNVSGQLSRRAQDAPSLLDASPEALAVAGVSPDSALRLLTIAAASGIPIAAPGTIDRRRTDAATFVARVDRPRFDYRTYEPLRGTWGVTAFGTRRQSNAQGIAPTTVPARGGELTATSGGVQAEWSRYIGKQDWLLEARSGLSLADERRTPWLSLPGASVLVGAPAVGSRGVGALQSLTVGGDAALASQRRTVLWETQAQVRFVPRRRIRHMVTITADARWDALSEDPAADRLGTFGYQSLTDLATGGAASFSRTLTAPQRAAGVWNGFLAVGDRWRASDQLRLEYGVRAEANRFTTAPRQNAALDAALGVRTSYVPNTVALSPRLGFTWATKPGGRRVRSGSLGEFAYSTMHAVRGGIGEFRSLLSPEIVTPVTTLTGLPDAQQRLFCVGDAVPLAGADEWAAWAAGASVPAVCRGGAHVLADAAPTVLALDRRYTAPRSWRANLAWSADRWQVAWTLEGVLALNRNQASTVDANFAGVPRFVLSDEGRPVFVPRGDVLPATGALSAVASRAAPAWSRVGVQRSDLRSTARQLTLTLRPTRPIVKGMHLSGAYVLGNVQQRFRGFDGSAFGDPRAIETARGTLDVRHQFLVQGGVQKRRLAFTLFARLQSSLPFTPLVGGDVNGDGQGGDRAFVFDPESAATDPQLAADTRVLFVGAPQHVRRCLSRTLGAPAGRNTCEGPWTASMNARLALQARFGQAKRPAMLALNFTNPLAGLDHLFHGERPRGWGTLAFPDPVLYQVRGFDPDAQRFRYQVNPRFGSTRPAATSLRAPFRLTLDVSVDLGQPLPRQQLDRWIRPGRSGHQGVRLSFAEILKRYQRASPDPFESVLEASDSLLLSDDQVSRVADARQQFVAERDSILRPFATWIAALGERWDSEDALRRQETTLDHAVAVAWHAAHRALPSILSPAQLRLLPYPASSLYAAPRPPRGWRTYSFGG